MNDTGKYEKTLIALEFIHASTRGWTPAQAELYGTAYQIDTLTARIVENSRRMAAKFEDFADQMELRGEGWSPMGYSTLHDLTSDIAKLEAFKESMMSLLRVVVGPDAPKRFQKALSAG